ncbi:hypothetical protein KSF_018630 [Reticulibacter mediterranei]|uniref:Uncharacterized protein n=1 Tax=Reticulibacter mediterranei TaxID=2778369 RepID=A0A8J3IJB1_9CHLR|nr:hypothetical protein KSF_018630 [Reticulibacter mediterranei]
MYKDVKGKFFVFVWSMTLSLNKLDIFLDSCFCDIGQCMYLWAEMYIGSDLSTEINVEVVEIYNGFF